jgi:hypothetical protein
MTIFQGDITLSQPCKETKFQKLKEYDSTTKHEQEANDQLASKLWTLYRCCINEALGSHGMQVDGLREQQLNS